MNERVAYIDGLRGIAILGVIFYHAYSRWGSVESYNQNQFFIDLFSHGWLGVQLFFAISGYVIYMSILRYENILMFLIARYLRLFPAMLIAALLIYSTSFFIPERPLGYSSIIDFLPSLTFIDPGLLSKITGLEIRSLDGAFWSLYVEVKFYFVAAFAYFIIKDRNLYFILIIYILWLLLTVAKFLEIDNAYLIISLKTLNYVGAKYYGWFLLGILAYKFNYSINLPKVIGLFGLAAIVAVTTKFGDLKITIAASLTASLFLLPFVFLKIRKLITNKVFLFFGYVSYPLYLVHQNLVTGLATKLGEALPALPPYLYPPPFIIFVIMISFVIAKIEPTIKDAIRNSMPKTLFNFKLLKG